MSEEKNKKNLEQSKIDCIFCKMASGKMEVKKILETNNFFAIRDINPKTQGHSLVISKKHYKTLLDVPASLLGELLETAKQLALKLLEEEKAQGFNVIMNNYEVAGQIIPHVHLHVLPRKKGDGFRVNV